MAKLTAPEGDIGIFGGDALATERTIFGDTVQSDDINLQFTIELLRGWGIVGANDQPTLQDFNAAFFVAYYLNAYLHQMGVAEYSATREYHEGSIVNVAGELYKSLQDDNVGNDPLTETLWWGRAGGIGDLVAANNLSDLDNVTTALTNLGVLQRRGTSITAAATTNIGAADSHYVQIDGNTTITSLGTGTARDFVICEFTGAPLLTHNGTSLKLPTGANIQVEAGDVAMFSRHGAAGAAEWTCVGYLRKSGQALAVAQLQLPAGVTVDRAYAEYTGSAALSTVLPDDDTIPQNTEGTEILSASITPKKSTNRLRVRVSMFVLAGTATSNVSAALFVDSTANAVQASSGATGNAGRPWVLNMEYEVVAGSTAAKTFKVRVGATAGNTYVNSNGAGARVFGGIAKATIVIEEIQQ